MIYIETMETKTCKNIDCKEINPQPLLNYTLEKHKDSKPNYRAVCRACRNEINKKRRHDDQEKYNQYMREYNEANKGTRKWKDRYKNKVLKKRYGVTLDKYNEMFKNQNGGCELCGKGPQKDNALCVDHHHGTMRVRGLLCHGCNRDIAILDNPERLALAKAYLAKYEPTPSPESAFAVVESHKADSPCSADSTELQKPSWESFYSAQMNPYSVQPMMTESPGNSGES